MTYYPSGWVLVGAPVEVWEQITGLEAFVGECRHCRAPKATTQAFFLPQTFFLRRPARTILYGLASPPCPCGDPSPAPYAILYPDGAIGYHRLPRRPIPTSENRLLKLTQQEPQQ